MKKLTIALLSFTFLGLTVNAQEKKEKPKATPGSNERLKSNVGSNKNTTQDASSKKAAEPKKENKPVEKKAD